MPDFTPNNELTFPEHVHDFGSILRSLRNNHGYSIQQVAKMVGMPPADISAIELSRKDLPSENVLRIWLTKLGCGKNTNKLAVMSRTYRVKHYITLNRNDTSNPDIIRVLEAYRTDKLSDYDKALLTLVGRSK